MQRVQGFAEQGDTNVFTAGQKSRNVVQGSFPYASVTVFLTGTTILATIYSDNQTPPTPLANPFTANANGHWFFYAANGRYDVRLSGQDLCPWTIGDILLADPTGSTGGVYFWEQNVQANGFDLIGAGNIQAHCLVLNGAGPVRMCVNPNGELGIVHVNSPITSILIGDPTQAGTMYLFANSDVGKGAVDLATNASWTGVLWTQIDPLISSWLVGFRNSSPSEVNYPTLWSVRYMEAGDPPGVFPKTYLAIRSQGHVGLGTDSPSFRLDVAGDVNIIDPGNAQGYTYRINGVPIVTGGGGTTFNFKGSVLNHAALLALPGPHTVGDAYITEDNNHLWVWNGSTWIDLGPAAGGGGISGINVLAGSTWVGNQPTQTVQFYAQGTGLAVSGLWSDTGMGFGYHAQVSFAYISDIRIKKNIRPLEGGLSVINALRPVESEFNGLAQTCDGEKTFSIIAQELQTILPAAVNSSRMKLRPDDLDTVDLLSYNPNAILFESVLAIQQLDDRLRKVEAKVVVP